MSNKVFTYCGEQFTACSCQCHIVGSPIRHIVACCDLCYSPYIIAKVIMKDGTEMSSEDIPKGMYREISHFGEKKLDESLLDKALENAYSDRMCNKKELSK